MSNAKLIQVPAILKGVSTLADGGVSMRFTTGEMSPEQMAVIMEFAGQYGWMLFASEEIHEIPKEAPHRESGAKTPSQRLRSTLYVLWSEKYTDIPFDNWYTAQVEKIIDRIKKELPAR
jgi:hypothetical protein